MCLYVIYKILFSIINLIDEKRKREKELKDFINYIKDEDLKREWEAFFKKKIMPKKQILLIGKIICILLKRNNMQTKFKIVETENYVLAVSDEEIKTNTYWIYICPINGLDYGDNNNPVVKNNLPKSWFDKLHDRANYKKVIGYISKNNAPELDLPLLPEIVVEDDVEKLALNKFPITKADYDFNEDENQYFREIWIEGHKTATKVYSEEDVRKAIEIGEKCIILNSRGSYLESKQLKESFIQSLKQPTPKWFVAEMEGYKINGMIDEATSYRLKTIIINGKTYLVGKFENE